MKQILILVLFVLICLSVGAVGSLYTAEAIPGWYVALTKPSLNPPAWLFGPVWTALYILMGISIFLVWKNKWKVRNKFLVPKKKAWNKWSGKLWTGDWQKQNLIAIFVIQLVLNALWSYIFFGRHQIGLAFFELVALWFAILYTIINFYRVSKVSAALLIPYIFWVTFAAYLNYSVWILNR
ncbi:MAG: tryptophan-rich sensory protein [Candidatus Doudnabacteria bacterium]|nr:tryptophan-rich sensory protein [Candidatus Doudnabacteria bacterium]